MFKSISAVIVGSIIVFFWGYLSWMVMDWHQPKNFKKESELAKIIQKHAPEHGIYAMPAKKENGTIDEKATEKGPFVYAVIRPGERTNYNMSRSIAISWMTALMGSIALSAMMQMGAKSFIPRLLIGVFAGFFVAVTTATPLMNWFEYPLSHIQAAFFDGLIPWTLAGIAMAYVLSFKSKKKAEDGE